MRGRVFQRDPNKPEKWTIVFDAPRKANGARNQKTKTFTGTKRQAEKELTRLLSEVNAGTYCEPSKAKDTLAKHIERWLGTCDQEGDTYTLYESLCRCHIIPAFGERRLDTIKTVELQDFITEKTKAGLSSQTVSLLGLVLRGSLNAAVGWGLIPSNPAAGVKLPAIKNAETPVLSEEELTRLLAETRGTGLHIIIALAASTGARRGELLGLRWEDVDLERGTVTISHSLARRRSGGVRMKDTKTGTKRTLALTEFARSALIQCRARQAQNKLDRLREGKEYHDNGYICCRDNGEPWRPATVSEAVCNTAARLGIKGGKLHGLRHTYATMAIERGASLKLVQHALGHTSPVQTLGRYAHVTAREQELVAQAMNETFQRLAEGL